MREHILIIFTILQICNLNNASAMRNSGMNNDWVLKSLESAFQIERMKTVSRLEAQKKYNPDIRKFNDTLMELISAISDYASCTSGYIDDFRQLKNAQNFESSQAVTIIQKYSQQSFNCSQRIKLVYERALESSNKIQNQKPHKFPSDLKNFINQFYSFFSNEFASSKDLRTVNLEEAKKFKDKLDGYLSSFNDLYIKQE